MNSVSYNDQDKCYIFECPACQCLIQVEKDQVNCQIFRHGVYKQSFQQINPHEEKDPSNEIIHGCGKQFQMFQETGIWSYVKLL